MIAPPSVTPYTHRRTIEDDMSVADKSEKKSGGLGETVSVIVQALLLALVIRITILPAVLDPVRLDAPDAPGRRLFVRHQMGLRLFALFDTVQPQPLQPHLGAPPSAATSRCSSSRPTRRSTTSSA